MSDSFMERPADQTGRSGERPVYSIGAVAQMLDVDVATLRAWEDRYAMVVPARSQGGQRIYSRVDLEHLRLVIEAIRGGAGAGDAHRLLGEKLHLSEGVTTRHEAVKNVVILLAERDRFAAELAEYLLKTEGYDVVVAFGLDEVERLHADKTPDLVVVELMIAGGGIDLCERFSRAGEPPLLAISALNLADEALAAGAAAFLIKPLEPLQFVSTVRDLLRESALTKTSHVEVS